MYAAGVQAKNYNVDNVLNGTNARATKSIVRIGAGEELEKKKKKKLESGRPITWARVY